MADYKFVRFYLLTYFIILFFSILGNNHGCSEEYTAFSASDDLFVNVMNLEDVKFMREKRDAQMSSTITVNNSKGSTEQNTSVTNTTEFTTSQPEEPLSPSPLPNSTYSHPPMMVEDNHSYYFSVIRYIPYTIDKYFVLLHQLHSADMLNSWHRKPLLLPFTFPFYGHNIRKLVVSVNGFVYMGPFLHPYLSASQYVSPLMANFDTLSNQHSNVLFKQVGDEFIIEWRNVFLVNNAALGSFTFQAKLKDDGTITFVYKKIPVPITTLSKYSHFKIGLSDAFYNDTHLPKLGVIQRMIVEYHRVSFGDSDVQSGTVITLIPLPTCNAINDCKICEQHRGVDFDCRWCDTVSRCSDGLDWYRQDWHVKGCHQQASGETKCSSGRVSHKTAAAVAAAIGIIVLALPIGGIGMWIYWAYTHPTSSSGIWMMEHRPSQLRARLSRVRWWRWKADSRYNVEETQA